MSLMFCSCSRHLMMMLLLKQQNTSMHQRIKARMMDTQVVMVGQKTHLLIPLRLMMTFLKSSVLLFSILVAWNVSSPMIMIVKLLVHHVVWVLQISIMLTMMMQPLVVMYWKCLSSMVQQTKRNSTPLLKHEHTKRCILSWGKAVHDPRISPSLFTQLYSMTHAATMAYSPFQLRMISTLEHISKTSGLIQILILESLLFLLMMLI